MKTVVIELNRRLPNQPPEGVEGKLTHLVEPRLFRGTISISF